MLTRCFVFAIALLLATASSMPAAAQDLVLLQNGDMTNWEYQTFKDIPPTAYDHRVTDDDESSLALYANSEQGASGYIRYQTIDLDATPWLQFRWRVDALALAGDETQKSGDDFAIRLYFVGQSGLQYYTLNLVYSQHANAGSTWVSPYAGFLRSITLYAFARHDPARLGQWQTTTINLAELWRQHYGDAEIGLIGIMTDSDNTAGHARSHYANIHLLPAQP